MDRRRAWIEAARPRTLPAAVAPVLVGSGLALGERMFRVDSLVAAMVGALAIQVAANFANDASDARRGADTPDRVGPQRMVATGVITSRDMWIGVVAALALAAAMGVWLIAIAGWPILIIGVVSVLAMLTYVGGPIPYGYRGLGEVMVFVFFGLVATIGTRFAHGGGVGRSAWLLGAVMGALAAAILVANNLRDIATDTAVGKRTLAVMLGEKATRSLYGGLVIGPFVAVGVGAIFGVLPMWTIASLLLVLPAGRLWRQVRSATTPIQLVPTLGGTARLQLVAGILLAVTLAI